MDKHAPYYSPVDSSPDFAAIEARVLDYWKHDQTFKQSVENRPTSKGGANNEFIFYDGPPFANGLPHYGHLLTGFVKDLFARYQTMRGRRVERRFGWDCHGLPAEMGAERDLQISGRQSILRYGIDRFNDYCRSSVMQFTHEWEYYVTRQARWVDFENGYKTMDTGYMESVLWAFKQLHEKGLIYEAFRVMPYSWAAETPLSNFETRLDDSYRERVDKAVTVAFTLKEKPPGAPEASHYAILAWTTTPWTLPSNLAVAVNRATEYSYIVKDDVCYLIGSKAAPRFAKELGTEKNGKFEIRPGAPTVHGEALVGASYVPLFPYFADHASAFRILDGSAFVTDEDGTGIVHMAPGFGEEDQKCCEANGIAVVCPVDHAGRFTAAIFDLADLKLEGMNVLEENVAQYRFGEANERIAQWLKQHGHLLKQDQITHNYPHCWRTDKPLIYKAVPSWYVEVTKFRGRMVELNQQINWIPGHIKNGLFGKWLENARDWSISRNRFWGTPIPVWRSDDPGSSKLYVFGSIAELEAFFGQRVTDLHRPFIDALTCPDPENPAYTLRRVEDVFDCWFESGSMPYAQVHYPFEHKDWFEQHFPADFIVEYAAQTRGWFYTLMVLGTALFDKPPFLNCICHGVVLDDKGQKLSKRLGNYPDPKHLFEHYGADALRWFMMASPVMRGSELNIDKDGLFIRDVVRLAIKPIWNAYNFFCLYANADGVKAHYSTASKHVLDQYILINCRQAVEKIAASLDAYDTPGATEAVTQCFEALNNWYIRRSKDRFWKSEKDEDKQAAYDTLYTVLVTLARAAAPLLPLTMEEIHRNLTREHSVHLADFPDVSEFPQNQALLAQMETVREICNAALSVRNRNNIRVRQPLQLLRLVPDRIVRDANWTLYADIVRQEVNVKEVRSEGSEGELAQLADFGLQIHFPVLGKRLPEKIKQIIPAAKKGSWKRLADGRVEVAGETLEKSEFTLRLEPKADVKDSAHPLSSNDALVILSLAVTSELEEEGYARDLVRLIQQARKDAGLKLSDRIHLRLRLSPLLHRAMQTHRDYVAAQVLAASLTEGDMNGCTFITNETIENEEVSIGFAPEAMAA